MPFLEMFPKPIALVIPAWLILLSISVHFVVQMLLVSHCALLPILDFMNGTA